MSSKGLAAPGIAGLRDVMTGHVARGEVAGLAWAVSRHGATHVGAAGAFEPGGGKPVQEDTIFRISSMTKPITAVAALILVEECVLRLDEPVDRFLPELTDRRVMVDPNGALTDTVPAHRSITLRDLLTFRLGWGMDFTNFGPAALLGAMAELGLGAGPPAPAGPPEPDEWIRRLGTLPLAYQPGERWLYNTGADVLGVLIARASGQLFGSFLRERVFEPLGMRDTGFSVPDYLAFARMLRAGGVLDGRRILSRPSIEVMTTNQLTPEQLAASGPDPSGAQGWGFGVSVQMRRTAPARSVGTYGWDGGLGSVWANDPAEDLVGVLMTNQMWTSPVPPPVAEDFWTCVYAAIDG